MEEQKVEVFFLAETKPHRDEAKENELFFTMRREDEALSEESSQEDEYEDHGTSNVSISFNCKLPSKNLECSPRCGQDALPTGELSRHDVMRFSWCEHIELLTVTSSEGQLW